MSDGGTSDVELVVPALADSGVNSGDPLSAPHARVKISRLGLGDRRHRI
jgi:hypothetical protein